MSNSSTLAAPPPELAPSQMTEDSVGLARIVGLMGLAPAVVGLGVILANQFVGPRLIGVSGGVIALAFGLILTLYAALRETDATVLRWYGFMGFGLILLSGVLTIANPTYFPLYGWPGLLVGLCFLICHARKEADPSFSSFTLLSILGIGVVFSLVGLAGGAFQPEFLLHYGLILALLGVLYLAAYLGLVGTYVGTGYQIARGIGYAGLAFFLFGLVRSVLPNVGAKGLVPYTMPQGLFLMAFGLLFAAVGIGSYSDNKLIVLGRRELAAYFYSPIAYLILIGMTFIGLVNFYTYLGNFNRPVMEPIVGSFLMNIIPALVIVFIVPALTMRLFSEEMRTGSFEVLMGAPVSELSVVLGKFVAALIFFVLMWVPFAFYLLPLRIELGQPFDYRPVISFFIALTFVGAGLVSMGLFFSSLTKNQIIAAVLTFAGMLFLLLIVILVRNDGDAFTLPETLRRVFTRIAFWATLSDSIQGRLYLRDLAIHASMTVFWLFLTVKSIESRKWS